MPTSRFPEFNFSIPAIKQFAHILLGVIFLQGSFTFAEEFNPSGNANVSTVKAASFTKQDDFLPVTEAYKLNAEISDSDATTKKLRLTWTIADKYYLYQERFKFRATPEVALTPTFSPEGKPKFDEFAGKDMTLHYHEVTADFFIPANTPSFDLKVTSQGCAEAGLCYPPYSENLHIDTSKNEVTKLANKPRVATDSSATSADQAQASAEEDQLWAWQALLFAFLGGVILNLMPCVFPVLSIKVLSLVQSHGQQLKLHGLMYTLGIVASFAAFAGLLLIAKAGGQAVGWGFQLQSPGLVTALAYLFFIMGLAMAGYIQVGGSLMGVGQSLTEKSGLQGSFFTGVLAAVVASPCTAPFMGAALGFALTQPAYVCVAVFVALGVGMAVPLLLLCFLPQFAQKLPRPGLWMETLKEFLAFPLYISAIWLLWVLTNQAGSGMMLAVCLGAVAIAFAFWIYRRPTSGWTKKIYTALALAALLLAIFIPYKAMKNGEADKRWIAYTPELLAELRAQGRPVFIDVTADWCITCKVNERTTLNREEVEAAFDELNVATLKADWTNADPQIKELLRDYGRIGVPLYVWFPAGSAKRGEVLPQLLTPSIVINTIKPAK
ncbi:hypothetical protein GCM10011613_09920 [Cellvibrio zantedeschiae]|uniref:Cytochrome C biogenesis protein n=1 Tax=Cellvibrio zantedeschiae TaxID=1237077 RepID=A0ABQ3AU10_9GAMM|nr:protein-disulfide reductase DsbD [Cellvibrio zantedeschiae]GGY67743.1 hypothetical protein GCM10011613_09920 [Cellvibrio zantedeschiae]